MRWAIKKINTFVKWKWNVVKRFWGGITVLIILFLSWYYILQLNIATSIKIQCIAVVALVIITGSYTYHTYKLVEEGKKKRDADFWEKRIIEFYMPFIEKLNALKNQMSRESGNGEKLIKKIDGLRDFFLEKKYMIPEKTSQQIESLQEALWTALLDDKDLLMMNFYAAENEVRDIISNEWGEIENNIRKLYGY